MSGFVHGLVARGAGLAPAAPPPRPASLFLPPAEAVPEPAADAVRDDVTPPALEGSSEAPVRVAREATAAVTVAPAAPAPAAAPGPEPASNLLVREPPATAQPEAILLPAATIVEPPAIVIAAHPPASPAAERPTPAPAASIAHEVRESVVTEQPRVERAEAPASSTVPRVEPAPPPPAAEMAGPPQPPAPTASTSVLRPLDQAPTTAAPQPATPLEQRPAPSRPAQPRLAQTPTLLPQPPRRDPPTPALRESDREPAIEVRIGRIEVRPPRVPEPPPPQLPAPPPERGFDDLALTRRGLDRRWY